MPVFLHDREEAHGDFSNGSSRNTATDCRLVLCTASKVRRYLSIPDCCIGGTGWGWDERRGDKL